MIGRSRALGKQRRNRTASAKLHLEVDRLRTQVTRLERALEEVIDASDDVLIDLCQREQMLERIAGAPRRSTTAGFEAAWTRFERNEQSIDDGFFADTQSDERSRRWLLASK